MVNITIVFLCFFFLILVSFRGLVAVGYWRQDFEDEIDEIEEMKIGYVNLRRGLYSVNGYCIQVQASLSTLSARRK